MIFFNTTFEGRRVVFSACACVAILGIGFILKERRSRSATSAVASRLLSPSMIPGIVLKDGLVLLRQCITPEMQVKLASISLKYGHGAQKFWQVCSHDKENCTATLQLNNERQGRGRIYDAVSNYPSGDYLTNLCRELTDAARLVDPTMPSIEPTHLLTMYYTTSRHLGWHRDNGQQDGRSLQPVVSISLGNTCRFLLRDDDNDDDDGHLPEAKAQAKADSLMDLELESGDVLLFGGHSRWIRHSVAEVRMGTCPPFLLEAHRESLERYCPEKEWTPPDSFRINLTFRHAPELRGREGEDKFFYFATSARKFAEKVKEGGVVEARRKVVEGRRRRKEEKKRRRKLRGLSEI